MKFSINDQFPSSKLTVVSVYKMLFENSLIIDNCKLVIASEGGV